MVDSYWGQICSVGNHTRRLLWDNGSLETLCSLITELFNARDASSFISGLPLDMGLFLIEPWLVGNSVCERVVNPEEQLQDGCVVEVLSLLHKLQLPPVQPARLPGQLFPSAGPQ